MAKSPTGLRYSYPFADGMTEFDLLGVLFIHFDSRITNSQALKQITAEIMNACAEDIKDLKVLKADGEKWNFPDYARITDDDIAKRRKQLLVYSQHTVTKALMRIGDKRIQEMPPKERARYLHKCAVEFDKQRIESHPHKCYALCKENANHPLAKKHQPMDEVEKKHELQMKELERKIKSGELEDDGLEKKEKAVSPVAAAVDKRLLVGANDSDRCALNDGSKADFCIFDLFG